MVAACPLHPNAAAVAGNTIDDAGLRVLQRRIREDEQATVGGHVHGKIHRFGGVPGTGHIIKLVGIPKESVHATVLSAEDAKV